MILFLSQHYRKYCGWFFLLVMYGDSFALVRSTTGQYSFRPLHTAYLNNRVVMPVIRNEAKTPEASPETPPAGHLIVASEAPTRELIGGPGQPEMKTFQSVGVDNMVSPFTGDFSYSIPLLDIGGYPVNLFYNAGISMEQEASWVGLGWNINPGTISRNMRGLPDDFDGSAADGDKVTKVEHFKEDLTVGAKVSMSAEIASMPLPLGISTGIFWNNRKGFGLETGTNFSIQHSISQKGATEKTSYKLGFNAGVTLNSQSGLSVNAGFEVTQADQSLKVRDGAGVSAEYNSRVGLQEMKFDHIRNWISSNKNDHSYSASSAISFAKPSFTPSIRTPTTRENGILSVKLGGANSLFHGNSQITGYFTRTYIAEDDWEQTRPAFGYMYYQRGVRNDDALLDFNRINDRSYSLKSPLISAPVYTYDVFTINGEGTGGSFRGYRGKMGFVADNYTRSKSGSFNVGFDAGAGNLVHVGLEGIGGTYTTNETGSWKGNNLLRNVIQFEDPQNADNTEAFYFKNPAEKAIIDEAYYNRLGGESLMRPALDGVVSPMPALGSKFDVFRDDKKFSNTITLTRQSVVRDRRDKRAQVISSLTAEEASRIGLDKEIHVYPENVFKSAECPLYYSILRHNSGDPNYTRKPHHLSEIDVLESDGKRYVFGIPAYNTIQKDVTMSVKEGAGRMEDQLVEFSSEDASVANRNGRDGLYQSEVVRNYAHSFLLTAILSPDYSDLTGDGISDDDIGTAVKFNYTRPNKRETELSWAPNRWRTPYVENEANYNVGLRTDNADDKGIYSYGEKELWYVHSIETKNMIATFTLSKRNDGISVEDEYGGLSLSADGQGQRKLDRIDLYTKSEFKKQHPKPLKSVHFEYSYKLCPNIPSNNGLTANAGGTNVNSSKGKLTLESVWFSYNGNYAKKRNQYRFQYATEKSGINVNPGYDPTQVDRWGSYKPAVDNPSGSLNIDFPYSLQKPSDKVKSDIYASAWNLEKILTPGGAVISVEYESDDYAFVQNLRASQMTRIVGIGPNAVSLSNRLYQFKFNLQGTPGAMDHNFVFVEVDKPLPIPSTQNSPEIIKQFIKEHYLEGFLDSDGVFGQILLKLFVNMPSDSYGSGYEPVFVYANIADYGPVEGQPNRFWIELKKSSTGGSKIMETVIQFLKDNLPSKAYPGYDAGNTPALEQIVMAIHGMAAAIKQTFDGFEYNLKSKSHCMEVDLTRSFARIHNPFYAKRGGGHRVKRVLIFDNWRSMSNAGNAAPLSSDAYYGTEYSYTKTEMINGLPKEISSGVATYEPGIGNEENPFRKCLQYSEKQPLGPTNVTSMEIPVTETFFPTPSVGYSYVSSRSIHNKTNKNLKSGTGTQVTEFYTCKDFPVITDYTDFDGNSRRHCPPRAIDQVLFNYHAEYMTLSQGFRIILNDMHGKMKSQSSYPEGNLQTPINSTHYFYRTKYMGNNTYRLDNQVPVIEDAKGYVVQKLIGKDIEVMNEFREHYSHTYGLQLPGNFESFLTGPFPIVLLLLLRMKYEDQKLFRSTSTMKVVNEYGILDSIVQIDKGSIVSTKNLVYDAETGEPLITRTNNEFRKPVYKTSMPVHWVNEGMGMAYKNIDKVFIGVNFRNGRIINPATEINQSHFMSGDEIYVSPMSDELLPLSLQCTNAGYLGTSLSSGAEYRLWVLDSKKDAQNIDQALLFIDRMGNPFTQQNMYVRIVRSGRRNLFTSMVGNIVSLANPVRKLTNTGNDIHKLIFDNATGVVTADAAEFKERWRVQDAFYGETVTGVFDHYVPIRSLEITASEVANFNRVRYGDRFNFFYAWDQAAQSLPVMRFKKRRGSSNHESFDYQSFIRFPQSGLSNTQINLLSHTVKIKSVKLPLLSHKVTSGHEYVFRHGNNNAQEDGVVGITAHGSSDPHKSNPLPFMNQLRISRMNRAWPGPVTLSNSGIYAEALDYNPDGYYNSQIVIAPPTPAFDFTGAHEIDITPIFTGMVMNARYNNFFPGLKLSMEVPFSTMITSQYNQLCFHGNTGPCPSSSGGGLNNGGVKDGCVGYPNLSVKIKAYDCTQALPYGTLPPPGEEQDYDICKIRSTQNLCKSVFGKQFMNPYVQGLLGVWRPDKSYVYYGYRKEKSVTTPNQETDIASYGVIENFEVFWDLGTNGNPYLTRSSSSKWKWTTEVTQLSRKGMELENVDPLFRYNAGIYGYQETLPVAVANNARLREVAFDGFEDYDYSDQNCELLCSPYKRHLDFGSISDKISSEARHTGKKSLKLNGNEELVVDVPVKPVDNVYIPDLKISMQNNTFTYVTATLGGVGLTPKYYYNMNYSGGYVGGSPETPSLLFDAAPTNPPSCMPGINPPLGCSNFTAEWVGKIVAAHSNTYEFHLGGVSGYADDEATLFINGTQVAYSNYQTRTNTATPVQIAAGQSYDILLRYKQTGGNGQVLLKWKPVSEGRYQSVSIRNLYPQGATIPSQVADLGNCVVPDAIKVEDHQFIDRFSPLAGGTYVLSAWAREGTTECNCPAYLNNAIEVVANGVSLTAGNVLPSGTIIEGWQRYDLKFDVPNSATGIQIKLKNLSPGVAFFDDIRIQPTNANLKSFVYGPDNLRLTAEMDENNFATFYEYDDAGTLVRVKKETVKGIKTIKESRSSMQLNITNF